MHDLRCSLHYGKVVLEQRGSCRWPDGKPFSGPKSLEETGSAHPDPPKTALQGR